MTTAPPKRYPGARWAGPVPNVGGHLSAPRLIVAHIMQGSIESCDAWFHNPDAQVSAHFGVAKSGEVLQWVELDRVAWAEADYNGVAFSIEHEGFSGGPLTERQLGASIRLMRWLAEHYPTIRLERTQRPQGSGVIGHGELGMAGGNHPGCPGEPVLRQLTAQLAAIVRKSSVVSAVTGRTLSTAAPTAAVARKRVPAMFTPGFKQTVHSTIARAEQLVRNVGAWLVVINDFVTKVHLGNVKLGALNLGAFGVLLLNHHKATKAAAPEPRA